MVASAVCVACPGSPNSNPGFHLSSAGQLPPGELFAEAIDVLEAKCDKLLENLQ